MSPVAAIALVLAVIGLVGGLSYAGFRLAVRRGGHHAGFPEPLSLLPEGADPSRTLRLEGVTNLRDLGGLAAGGLAAAGAVVATGKVFRSGHWGNASASDQAWLEARGVRTVIDLRGKEEVEAHPDRLPAGVRGLWIPIHEDGQAVEGVRSALLFHRDRLGAVMDSHYRQMLRTRADRFGEALSVFADPANLPVCFHCTAGKDRAGTLAALLLSLLGVDRRLVIEDYALSNLAFEAIAADPAMAMIAKLGIPPDELGPLIVADPRWLSNALDWIDSERGGMEAFLAADCGLSGETVAAIRQNLLFRR